MTSVRPTDSGARGAFALLDHPLTLAALALWALNDHLLKGVGPATLTGKLSDVAGLAAFPVILAASVEALARPILLVATVDAEARAARARFRPIDAAALATAAVFAAVKLVPAAASAYALGLGVAQWPFRAALSLLGADALPALLPVAHTMDPTDLLALPAALAGPLAARRAARR